MNERDGQQGFSETEFADAVEGQIRQENFGHRVLSVAEPEEPEPRNGVGGIQGRERSLISTTQAAGR